LYNCNCPQTFKINCQFTETWRDARITVNASESVILQSSYADKLWRPTSYFFNAVETERSPLYQEITGDSTIIMSSRLIIKLTCAMHLAFYPHDTQHCHVQLETRK
jgi:hypothetical protein